MQLGSKCIKIDEYIFYLPIDIMKYQPLAQNTAKHWSTNDSKLEKNTSSIRWPSYRYVIIILI